MSDSGSAGGQRGKVVGLIEKRGLNGIGDRLEARWTAEGDDRITCATLPMILIRRSCVPR